MRYVASRNGIAEDCGLCGELVEGRKLEAGITPFVDLLVGELIEQEPDNASFRGEGVVRLVERQNGVHIAGLPAEPQHLPEGEQGCDGDKTNHDVNNVENVRDDVNMFSFPKHYGGGRGCKSESEDDCGERWRQAPSGKC